MSPEEEEEHESMSPSRANTPPLLHDDIVLPTCTGVVVRGATASCEHGKRKDDEEEDEEEDDDEEYEKEEDDEEEEEEENAEEEEDEEEEEEEEHESMSPSRANTPPLLHDDIARRQQVVQRVKEVAAAFPRHTPGRYKLIQSALRSKYQENVTLNQIQWVIGKKPTRSFEQRHWEGLTRAARLTNKLGAPAPRSSPSKASPSDNMSVTEWNKLLESCPHIKSGEVRRIRKGRTGQKGARLVESQLTEEHWVLLLGVTIQLFALAF